MSQAKATVTEYNNYGYLDVIEFTDGTEWLLAPTNESAEDAATEAIKDSAWAFNSSFLASLTGLPQKVFSCLSEGCEDSNDDVLRVIEKCSSIETFVNRAINADGRGHFLSSYDGEEVEFRALDSEYQLEIVELLLDNITLSSSFGSAVYTLVEEYCNGNAIESRKKKARKNLLDLLIMKNQVFLYRNN